MQSPYVFDMVAGTLIGGMIGLVLALLCLTWIYKQLKP